MNRERTGYSGEGGLGEMELRRQVYISKLNRLGIYESSDGRILQKLTADELELELTRQLAKQGAWK